MKTNVDLTRNRDFSNNSNIVLNSVVSLLKENKRIPWSWKEDTILVTSDAQFESQELFMIGTTKRIKTRKQYKALINNDICDCCGTSINRYSWFTSLSKKTLCTMCEDRLNKEFNRNHNSNIFKNFPVYISNNYWTQYLNQRYKKPLDSD